MPSNPLNSRVWLLRQRSGVSVRRQVAIHLTIGCRSVGRRSAVHGHWRLLDHVLRMRHGTMWGRAMRRTVVGWYRVVGTLPDHAIRTTIWRGWHWGLITRVSQMRRCANLRTAMVRSGCSKWRLWCVNRGHGHSGAERLRLGIKGVVSVIAAWNGMLALGVMRVGISRQLPKSVRNATRAKGYARALVRSLWWSWWWRSLRRVGPRRIVSRLPSMRRCIRGHLRLWCIHYRASSSVVLYDVSWGVAASKKGDCSVPVAQGRQDIRHWAAWQASDHTLALAAYNLGDPGN